MELKKEVLILSVDLRYKKDNPGMETTFEGVYKIYTISNSNDIEEAIDQYGPDIICFDFDLPDQHSLSVLRDTKCQYPSIPFIMLTEDHSTRLAIWALRSRAWDYFVKPVNAEDVISSIDNLLEKLFETPMLKRNNFMPHPTIPSEARPYKSGAKNFSTVCAADYVQQHLASKITVESVANRCGMSKSHFSRTFKKEHGLTFQEFLIQQRMIKAVELLKSTDFHVTQIAFAVGYCELSNFTSTFQREIGIGPSSFRKALTAKQLNDYQYG